MTDRNLNRVKKLRGETWQAALSHANTQIDLLLRRCEDLVKGRDFAIGERDKLSLRVSDLEAKLSMAEGQRRAYEVQKSRLEGYRDRVREQDAFDRESISGPATPLSEEISLAKAHFSDRSANQHGRGGRPETTRLQI